MDLNDPRRRLQVLNSTNPSLRVSVAPQPTLRVAQPTPQPQSIAQPYTQPRLFVGNTEIPQAGPVQAPEPTPLPQAPARPTKWWDKAGSFVFGNTAKLLNTTAAGITGAIGLADIAKESIFGTDESYKRKVDQAYNNLNFALNKEENGGLFNQGTFFKNAQEARDISAGDLTKKIVGGGLGTAAEVVPFTRGAQLVETGGKLVMNGADDVARVVLPKFLPTAGRAALEGGAYAAVGDVGSQLADTGKVDGTQTALNALIGAGAGAGTFGLGRAVFKLRGGEEAAASRIISKMAKASNPSKIASMLTKAMPGVDKELLGETAKYIAQEDSKDAIEAILRSIEVDPSLNISGDVKQRLQDEGVTKVEKGDTPYGAEYAGNGVMRFKDADAASLDNVYHELGHHIYANKLTPEEKALFQNIKGQASQQAQGRKGYTPDDYASEDFSDFLRLAMTGKLKDVPEGVRDVVAKYAKVSTDLGDVVKSNADTVAKNFPDQVSDAYRKTGIQDSYNLILNALANNTNKSQVRDMVSQLVGNAEKTDVNRLTRRLTDAKTPEEVRNIIDEESRLASGEFARDKGGEIKPVEAPVTPEQVDEAAALQTGTTDTKFRKGEAADDNQISDQEMKDIVATHRKRFGDSNVKFGDTGKDSTLGSYNHSEDMITVANNKDHALSTYNHESVHKAISKFLSDAEIEQLYKDIVKVRGGKLSLLHHYRPNGYPGISWRGAAEEEIANQFANFAKEGQIERWTKAADAAMWAKKHDLPQSIVDIFWKLHFAIKEHISHQGSTDRLTEFYKMVENGDFNGAPRREMPYQNDTILDKLANNLGVYPVNPDLRPDTRRFKIAPEGTTVNGNRVEDVFPGISDPEQRAAVQKLMDGLDEAQGAYNDKTKVVAKEKAQRIAQAGSAYDAAGQGEEGFRAKLSALKGKYSESNYQPISVDPKVEKTMLNAIEKSNLQEFEKLNTQNALRKVWGANPDKPTASDISYIRRFMNEQYGEGVGDEFAKGMEEALKQGTDFGEVVSNIAGLPRALMATGDLSGGFRQALPLGTRFPKIWANANVESVKYAFNPKYYESEMKKIADAKDYNVISDKMGVDLTGVGAMQDEAFIGSGYAERIPVANIPIKAADRAYTGVLTRMRYDVASKLVKDAGGPEQFVKNMEEIYGNSIVKKGLFTGRTNKTDRAMRALGEVINTFTGRGGMKGGVLDNHMQTLSTLLFAPRLWAANINRLNPAWYGKMLRDNPQAAKLAIQSQGTFLAVAGTVLGLAAAAGAEVGTDPRSADFGKIKVGNTRYDILGGQQQNVVQFARQWTGQKVNSETGEVDELGDGYGAKNRFDLAFDMFSNKSNPLLAFAMKLMQTGNSDEGGVHRTDQYGKDFNVATEAAKLVTPLGIQGSIETSKDVGSIAKGVAMNAPSFFGVGVQTYGSTPSKDQTTAEDGTKKFAGKVTDDMVTDTNGNPILDDKGKPVKVKVPKDATDLERQALIDDKRKSALADQFRRTLPKEDQALMKLTDKQLKQYVKDGKIDQARMDAIKQHQKNAENVEGVDIPEGAKSQLARDFYLKYHSMDETRRKDWLKEEPDETAKTIAGLLNKERNEGLSEFKPSNALSKAYAEYENDLNTHPDYTEVDKRNKAKAFQTFAYKLNYNDNQKDLYNEGSSSDVRYLIDQKQISKEDLDAAMKMDDELYNSGLVGSLKFSKKFRTEFGYGVPDGGGKNDNLQAKGSGGRRGGRSGGKGDETPRTYISELLPGIKLANKGGDKPEFSTKPRTQGLKFKAPTPQKSGKKVSIRL